MKLIVALFFVVGCQTRFEGDPHVSPAACQQKCASVNMRVSGMVFMGEYSSACLCEVANAQPSTAAAGAAAVGGAVGVVMQTRNAQANQANQHH